MFVYSFITGISFYCFLISKKKLSIFIWSIATFTWSMHVAHFLGSIELGILFAILLSICVFFKAVFMETNWWKEFVDNYRNNLNEIENENRLKEDVKFFQNSYVYKKEVELYMDRETIPTDDEILLYYKMYCKKYEMDTKDLWTTIPPMPFKEWEEKAKTKTIQQKIGKDFSIMRFGGYQFIISMTCDTMIGIPPNQSYHRYRDYRSMVENERSKR